MTEISANVFMSSLAQSQDLENLKNIGITHVALVAAEIECPHQHYLFHQKFNIEGHPGYDILKHLDEIIDYITERLKRGKRVLILGNSGASRAVTVALAWVMHNDGMNFNKAWQHIQSLVPGANPNSGFINQLKKFEANLKEKNPNFGNTRTFAGRSGKVVNDNREAYEYTNHTQMTAGMNNSQRNPDNRAKINQFSESKGPHTDFWDVENKTFSDDKTTFRYKKGHNNEYLGQIPVDLTHSNKYFTKNPGLISPLKPEYEKHKGYEARQELNDKYSKVGLERAQPRERIDNCDERRNHEVWRMSENKFGRGVMQRDFIDRGTIQKRGDHLVLTSFKNGNFGF